MQIDKLFDELDARALDEVLTLPRARHGRGFCPAHPPPRQPHAGCRPPRRAGRTAYSCAAARCARR